MDEMFDIVKFRFGPFYCLVIGTGGTSITLELVRLVGMAVVDWDSGRVFRRPALPESEEKKEIK